MFPEGRDLRFTTIFPNGNKTTQPLPGTEIITANLAHPATLLGVEYL